MTQTTETAPGNSTKLGLMLPTNKKDWPVQNTLIRVVFNTNMQNGHAGLTKIASKVGVRIDQLGLGEFVVFINTRKTMLKLFAPGNTIAHFKTPDGHQLNMKVIALIPRFFNGKELRYDEALAEVIRKEIHH